MRINLQDLTEQEKESALFSVRYILEDLNEVGLQKLAEITDLPMGGNYSRP